jgi:hypothetical protein
MIEYGGGAAPTSNMERRRRMFSATSASSLPAGDSRAPALGCCAMGVRAGDCTRDDDGENSRRSGPERSMSERDFC